MPAAKERQVLTQKGRTPSCIDLRRKELIDRMMPGEAEEVATTLSLRLDSRRRWFQKRHSKYAVSAIFDQISVRKVRPTSSLPNLLHSSEHNGKSPVDTTIVLMDKYRTGDTLQCSWMSSKMVTSEGILHLEDRTPQEHVSRDDGGRHAIVQVLKDYNVDVASPKLVKLTNEVLSGVSRLMLDATRHKRLVRMVSIVMLSIRDQKGRILIESWDMSVENTIDRLPATKKRPHENCKQSAHRMIDKLMGQSASAEVTFNFDQVEVFEEEEDSPSYPGLATIYSKEIVPGVFTGNDSDDLTRVLILCPPLSPRPQDAELCMGPTLLGQSSSSNKSKNFVWLTEQQVNQKKVKLHASGDETISALVSLPVGLSE